MGAAVNDSTQDQTMPLHNTITEPLPPPEPMDTETSGNYSKSWTKGKMQVLS